MPSKSARVISRMAAFLSVTSFFFTADMRRSKKFGIAACTDSSWILRGSERTLSKFITGKLNAF
jgi:hypothetical protein